MSCSVRVAVCQTPEFREDIAAALRCVESFSTQAAAEGIRLLCFPECFLQGYLLNEESARRNAFDLRSPEFANVLQRLSGLQPMLVIGMIETDGQFLYNTAVVIDRGRLIGTYRKVHLLASEHIFRSGDSYPVFVVERLRFGINICCDTRFSEASAALAAQAARVILCPANNMLPRDISEAWKERHNEIRAQRAQETGLWLLSSDVTGQRDNCTSLGPTAIIRPDGQILRQVTLNTIGMISAEIMP